MGLFRRRAKIDGVPAELGMFDLRQWTRFCRTVEDDFSRRGQRVEFVGAAVRVLAPRAEVFGLLNLAQVCHQAAVGDWPTIVRDHFDGLRRAYGEMARVDDDVTLAAPLLKARLQPDDQADPDAALITRPYAESLALTVTLDLPDAVVSVKHERSAAWDVPVDELFAIALANVKAEGPPTRDVVQVADGTAITTLEGPSFFTTTWVHWLAEAAGPLPPEGALVAMPNRHLVMVHPVEGEKVITAVQHLIVLTRRLFDQGPGGLSRHLYWWRDGELRWLPASVDDQKIEFYPPPEFVEVLNELGGPPLEG